LTAFPTQWEISPPAGQTDEAMDMADDAMGGPDPSPGDEGDRTGQTDTERADCIGRVCQGPQEPEVRSRMFSNQIARNAVWGLGCTLFYTLGFMYMCFSLLDQPGGVRFAVVAVAFGTAGSGVVFVWRRELSWRLIGLGLWAMMAALMVMQLLVA